MKITHESIEIILDLIEIKVNALQAHNSDDVREINKLRKCKQEFLSLLNQLSADSVKVRNKGLLSTEESSTENG